MINVSKHLLWLFFPFRPSRDKPERFVALQSNHPEVANCGIEICLVCVPC